MEQDEQANRVQDGVLTFDGTLERTPEAAGLTLGDVDAIARRAYGDWYDAAVRDVAPERAAERARVDRAERFAALIERGGRNAHEAISDFCERLESVVKSLRDGEHLSDHGANELRAAIATARIPLHAIGLLQGDEGTARVDG